MPQHIWAFDIGSKSVGWAVMRAADDGTPTGEVIAANVVLHDGGILDDKKGTTRRAVRGEKVRARRRIKRRRNRRAVLRATMAEYGFAKQPGWRDRDPWWVRHRLATEPIGDPAKAKHYVAIALPHMARHRGWRNPWLPAPGPADAQTPERLAELARELDAPATLGAVCWALQRTAQPTGIRNRKETPEGQHHLREYVPKVLQEHIAAEIAAIWQLQATAHPELFSDAARDELAKVVLKQEKPGVPLDRIGRSEVGDPTAYRAPKSSPLFQRFRLLDRIANLRIRELDDSKRTLTVAERTAVYDLLDSAGQAEWTDVSKRLGIEHERLMGNPDKDGTSGRPPHNQIKATLRDTNIKAGDRKRLLAWWDAADARQQEAFIALAIADRTIEVDDPAGAERVAAELDELGLFELIETIGRAFPAGRAQYSRQVLGDLNDQMELGADLHDAIATTYGHVPPGLLTPWDEPVPHAGVEASMREVRRVIAALDDEFGPPVVIGIEIVRDAMRTRDERNEHNTRVARERDAREQARKCLIEDFGMARPTREQIAKREHMDAQENRCLYCGNGPERGFTFAAVELDHIVPRASGGATTFVNIAAVCRRCNQAKGRRPFALWCEQDGEKGTAHMELTLERVARLRPDRWKASPAKPYIDPKSGRWVRSDKDSNLDQIRKRLQKKSLDKEWGESLDDLQSTAYVSRVVTERIKHRYPQAKVFVMRGGLTAALRNETDIVFVVGLGEKKDRDDRRHHAVDAIALALLTQTTWAARTRRRDDAYRNFKLGLLSEARLEQERERAPLDDLLASVQNVAATAPGIIDAMIPVCPRRVRTTGRVHEDELRPWVMRLVGDSWDAKDIASVRDEPVRTALLRALPKQGALAADSGRTLTLEDGSSLAADSEVATAKRTKKNSANATWLPVRGGWAKNAEIHHARLIEVTWHENGEKHSKFALAVVPLADVYGESDPFDVPLGADSIAIRSRPELARALAVDPGAKLRTVLTLTQGDVFVKGGEAYQVTTFDAASNRAESMRPARYGGQIRSKTNPDGPKKTLATALDLAKQKALLLTRDHLGRPTT